MKARTKLVLMVLVPFLVSIILYSFLFQWYLDYQAMKLEKDPPSIFSIGVIDYLAGYLVFLLFILRSPQGLLTFLFFLAFWIMYFNKLLSDYLNERKKS